MENLTLTEDQVKRLNRQFEDAAPQVILEWAYTFFGKGVAVTSSFQTQSVPLLHMIAQVAPEMPILFLDTGFHFPETLAFRDRLVKDLGLTVRSLKPHMGHSQFRQTHGDLYRRDPDVCCYINKVEPLERAMQDYDAWVTGIRRDQTAARRHAAIISQEPNGKTKICPLATWTEHEVWCYLHAHNLPSHPLLAQGYLSIGCSPCTRPVYDGEDSRAGRWSGQAKMECGLHTANEPDRD